MLTEAQLRQFGVDGYLVVKGVVPEPLLAAADREIDELIAETPPAADAVGHVSYWPQPARLPGCDAALRESGALNIANELVAPHTLDHGMNDRVQVATNIPWWTHVPGGPHIDNQTREHFGSEPGSFTMLAAIFLSDESAPASGNLWVWPGSHHDHARLFAERGVDCLLPTGGHATGLEPPLDFGQPVPVLAERGDLLLAHFLLGHNSGGNESDTTRRIIYFRLAVEGHRDRWRETFLDPLTEYAPVRGLQPQ